MAFTLTDTDAENVYNAIYRHYAGQNMPDGSNGVFFGFANFTKDKLLYCIEALKKHYNYGWFTTNAINRKEALEKIAKQLYTAFNTTVDLNGIYKWLCWNYSFASKDSDIAEYFAGGNYGTIQDIVKNVTNKVSGAASSAAETVAYGVKYPSLETSVNSLSNALTPKTSTLIKWGLVIGAGWFVWRFIEKRIF